MMTKTLTKSVGKAPAITNGTTEAFLEKAAKQAVEAQQYAATITIQTDAQAEEAAAFASKAKERAESLDAERRKIVDPLNEQVKLINGRFKAVTAPLQEAVDAIRRAFGAYQQRKIDAAKQKALEKQQEIDARNAKAVKKAEAAGRELPPPPPQVIPAAPARQIGTAQVRMVPKFKLVDKAAVPVEYLTLDEATVRAKIATHRREHDGALPVIPGIEIKMEPETAFR